MHRSTRTSVGVFAIALFLRLALVAVALAEPVWDGFYYALGARRIAAGFGYSEDLIVAGPGGVEQTIWFPWAHYPVGYPGLIAFFLRVFGDHLAVAPVVNAVTGALLAVVAHRLARHVFTRPGHVDGVVDERRAAIAGFIVAIDPGLVLYSGAWMTEPLASLLMLGALLVAIADRSKIRGSIFAGVLLGLATLVRPNALLLAPFVGLAGLTRASTIPKSGLRWVARTAVVSALCLATVAPWTIRNCRVMDACALVSTNAGWNLVIGAAPGATGKFEFLVGHTPAGGPLCDDGGQVAQDRCWWRYGVSVIARDPRHWLALIPAKLHYTLDAEWFPINYLREARPDLVSASKHIAWGRLLTTIEQAIVALTALAMIGRPRAITPRKQAYFQISLATLTIAMLAFCVTRHEPICWPLAVAAIVLAVVRLAGSERPNTAEIGVLGMIATTLATHAIFFGEDRYHLVITPAFLILACGVGRRVASPAR
jgi:hypothetical protein